MPDFRDVDSRDLRVPPSCRQGADLTKLNRQIALFGVPLPECRRPGLMRGLTVWLCCTMASHAPRESQSWRRAGSSESR